jgi:hypothetical protein
MVEKNPPKGATKLKAKTAVTAKNKDVAVAKVAPAAKVLAKQNAVPTPTQPVSDVAAVIQQPKGKTFTAKEIEKCKADFRVIPLVALEKTVESALLFG